MLGKVQASVIASAIPALGRLAIAERWADIDAENLQFREAMTLDGAPTSGAFSFCAVMHASRWPGNVVRFGRSFVSPASGELLRDVSAETTMLRLVAGPG
jgi:hypothetical protein